MKRSLLSAAVMTLVATAICALSPLAAHAQPRASHGGGSKTETYLVVQIIDPSVEASKETTKEVNNDQNRNDQNRQMYKVINSTQLKDEKRRLEEESKEQLLEWEDAKKIDPQTPKPSKKTIKILKTFHTQKIADEYLQKLLDELAKKEGGDKPAAANAVGQPGPHR
jgi:hypothetical protein